MQRFFSVIIIFVLLVVMGAYLYGKKADEEARNKIESSLISARGTFADKARSAAAEDDNDAYLRSVQAALRGFDDELKNKVYKDKPDWKDPEAYSKRAAEQFKEKKIKEIQHKSMLEGYKIVREAYDKLTSASWRPVLTAKGKSETRLDIYEMRRARDDEGNPILEGKFFFWGVEDEKSTRMTWGQLNMRFWSTEMEKVKEGRKMVEKEVEKVIARAEGDAQPRIIMQNPQNYIADFPSYVSIGYVWFPVMPHQAEFVDIEFTYSTKKGGDYQDSSLKWEKLTIPSSWKLNKGEVWDAEVIEATEEEIAGKTPGEEDEEKAPEPN